MAEARQGIRPTPAFGIHERQIDATSQNVQFVYGRTGLHIYIPRPRILFRKFLRLLWRTGNKLQDACYPLPTWSIFVSNSVALFLVVGSESSLAQKYLQKHGKGMKYLWAAPLAKHLPEVYHRAMFAVNATSVSLFLFTSFHRAIIRHLLSYTGWVHELRAKNPSWMTKIWAFILRYGYIRSKSPLMLTYQNCLPKLPLPRLDDTVHGYLKTIEPLLDAEEIARQQNLAKNFLANEGKTLQRFLRVKHFFSSNYISNWWLEIVYLRHRKSLTLNSNYYGIGCAHGRPTQNQVSRAAVLIHNFVRCKLDIDHERIPPHLMNNFIPLCMDQYLHAFSVTRVPGMVQDQLAHYSSTTSRHVIVLYRGRIFAAPCFSTHTGRPLTAKQIETTLLGIVQDSSTVSETEAAIPILTSLPRSQWATLRETHFTQDPTNRTSLERIESALFVVSLEDVTPSDLTSEGLNYYLGNMGQNRWADKSFHLIVTADGRCGITAEHSWGDAPVIAHLMELSIAREVSEKPYDADGTVRRVARDVQKMDKSQFAAESLHFNITSELSKCIHEAIPVVEADFRSLDLKVGCYDQYGKGAVKKFRCGADAWIQIALQLAYYRDQGHFDLTYESGMTRLFRYGRTETIRSVSKSSCAFVRAIDDAAVAPSKKATLLREACEAHQSYSHNAMVGNGVDRHLLALYIVSVGMGMKSDFLADYIARPWKLSTSQIPQRQTAKGTWPGNDMGDRYVGASGGFGPVAEDGYGISYTIAGEFRIYFHISSKHEASNTDSKRMLQNVFRALDDMRALFPDVDLKDVQMPKEIAALSYNDTWS